MANKDVNLVIRAKNEASKSLNEVQGALDALKRAQDGVAASADKADKSLAALANEQERLKNIKAASDELAKAKARMDVAAGAAERLKGALGDANQTLNTLKADATKAAEGLATLSARSAELTARKAAEKQAVDAANMALSRESALLKELSAAKKEFAATSRKSFNYKTDNPDTYFAAFEKSANRLSSAQGAVDSARSAQAQAKAAYEATAADMRSLTKEIDVLKTSERGLAVEIANTEGRITNLSSDVMRAVTIHRELASAVQASSAELAQFSQQAGRSSAASGGMVAGIERLGALMQTIGRYSTGAGQFADPKTAGDLRNLNSALERSRADVALLEGQMQALDAEMARSATITKQLSDSQRAVTGALEQARQEVRRNELALANYATGGESAKDALIRLNRESRQAMSIGQRLRGEILSLATAYIGLYGAVNNIGAVLRNIQTMQGAETRLAVVFDGDPQKIGNEMAWLKGQAQRLGIEFGVLSDQYTKFAVSAQELKFTVADTRKVFLALAEAGRVNKLSADDMNGVFLALTQMMQKGKVSAEELRGQMAERLPGAVTLMARAFGYGTDQLDEFYKAMAGGGLDVNAEVMGKFADELNAKFGSQLQASLQNTTAAIGRFFNNLYEASLQFAKGGFLDAFNDGLARLNAWFESKAGHEFFLGLGAAAGKAYHIITGFFDVLVDLKGVIYTFLALKFASWVVSIGSAFSTSSTFIAAFRQEMLAARAAAMILGQTVTVTRGAMVAMNTVAAAFGGWIPMLITAGVTLATVGAGYWATSIDTATGAMDEHDRIMTAVLAKYDQLKGKAQDWADIVTSVTLDEANANVRSMMTLFEEARSKLTSDFRVGPGSFDGAARAVGRGGVAYSPEAQQINNLNTSLAQGKIKISEYITEINKMYSATKNDSLRLFLEGLLDQARAASDAADKTALAAEVAQKMGSVLPGLSDALDLSGKRLKEVAEAADDTGEAVKKALTPQEKYVAALKDMVTKIPSLSGELKKFKEATDLTTSAWTAFVTAVQTGDLSKIANVGQMFWGGMKGIFGFGGLTGPSFDVGGSLASKIIGVESGGNAGAQNPNSSATGLGQFVESTWLSLFKKYFPTEASDMTDAAILELRKNSEVSTKMVEYYLAENAKSLQAAGVAVNDANLYLAHFLGAGGAASVLKAAPGTPLTSILSADQIAANPSILGGGKTSSDVIQWAQGKMGAGRTTADMEREVALAEEMAAAQKKVAEERKKQAEEAAKGAAANEKALSDLGFETDILKMKTDGLSKEAFIEEKIHALKSSSVALTAEQEAKARELLAKQYDYNEALKTEKNTKTGIEAIEQRISDLQSQKSSLGEIKDAYAARGDAAGVSSTEDQIKGVNSELLTAIQQAEGMYEALGGAGADAALAKLEALRMSIEGAGESTQKFRFTMDEVKSTIFDSMESGIVDMFKSFATAIANGENAIKNLGQAFRQFAANFLMEIAQMILKQALFNALSGITKALGGAVGGFMGLPTLTLHSGGIVGASTGSGNMMASPAWFQNAVRYHTGGIVGLQPNEVPAILQTGEEVLTANDPNHSRNRGAGGGAGKSVKVVNMFDAGSFVSEALKSAAGEEAILNHVRANPSAWRSALEG